MNPKPSVGVILSELIILSMGTCLDRELAPKDPTLGPIGLPPWLEDCTSVRWWSGDLAAAIGWEVAVKLAKGLCTRDWVDIIKTSIRIWPIRSFKSAYTVGERINSSLVTKCWNLSVVNKSLAFQSAGSFSVSWWDKDIPSFGFWWNSAASEGRKMTSLSCSFHDTRRILQTSCRACSSETSEFAEVSWGATITGVWSNYSDIKRLKVK